MSQRELLERFVTDNPELEELEDLLAGFNIFEVLKLQRQEIRHSNFLAWLLDPTGTHGLGTYVLKRFLSQTTSQARTLGIETISPVDIDVWDWSDTQVSREGNNFDLLILNDAHQFACVIENKLFSGEHGHQLERYRHRLEQIYPEFARHHVLLSPEADLPEEDVEKEFWTPLGYQTVCKIIDDTIQGRQSSMSPEVRIFLQHYTDMLRRNVLEDSEVQQLARKIYQRHRDAITLINEHIPDMTSLVRQVVEDEVQNVPGLVLDHCSKGYIRFVVEQLLWLLLAY